MTELTEDFKAQFKESYGINMGRRPPNYAKCAYAAKPRHPAQRGGVSMDLLKFVFRDFWMFCGCVVLLYLPCQTILLVSYNIAQAFIAKASRK